MTLTDGSRKSSLYTVRIYGLRGLALDASHELECSLRQTDEKISS